MYEAGLTTNQQQVLKLLRAHVERDDAAVQELLNVRPFTLARAFSVCVCGRIVLVIHLFVTRHSPQDKFEVYAPNFFLDPEKQVLCSRTTFLPEPFVVNS